LGFTSRSRARGTRLPLPGTDRRRAGFHVPRVLCAIFALLTLAPVVAAQEEPSPAVPPAQVEPYRTPRAGEAFTATVFGHSVDVPARDRTHTSAFDIGVLWIPDGPDGKQVNPFATLFFWRNWNDGGQRLRAVLVGVYDDVRWDFLPGHGRLETVLTFQNLTPPFDRSEYVEGVRVRSEDLRWYEVHGGAGLGYRAPLSPGHQDNALEAALSYEPGYLWFDRADKTAPSYIVPTDTYEGRVHFRFRADTLERNPIELPHEGFAAGLDAVHARRSEWDDWGGPVLGFQSGSEGQEWNTLTLYAAAALPVPFVRSERHRLVASVHGGMSRGVDRFSAFRLGGGPTISDWEALSRPVLPAAAFEEIRSRSYGIMHLEYRYEMLFFAYLRLIGTLAQVDRLRFDDSGGVVARVQPMNALSLGVTSGFLWHSELELGYTYNFGILRQREGESKAGDGAILVHWSKSF